MPSLASSPLASSPLTSSPRRLPLVLQPSRSPTEPHRVLQVVGSLDRGGIETWLMHVLRRVNRDRLAMDFLVHTDKPGHYDAEAKALGSEILVCPHAHNPWHYRQAFRQLLQERSPYDTIHSHVHYFSGYVLRLAAQLQIPQRIAHSHNDTRVLKTSWLRQRYHQLMGHWLRRYATQGLAASQGSAEDLFTPQWQQDPRWRVFYCGVDLQPFQVSLDRAQVRQELGIPPGAFVVGHVGRFAPQKNHAFLVRCLAEAIAQDPSIHLLLVGTGDLEATIRQSVQQLGIESHVIFTGVRPDVPRLMAGAMDCFCLPSHHEGLGLVLIEAQAAGLPCLVSPAIPPEARIPPHWMQTLSLEAPVTVWAQALLHLRQQAEAWVSPGLESVLRSPFNIDNSIASLEELYLGQPARL